MAIYNWQFKVREHCGEVKSLQGRSNQVEMQLNWTNCLKEKIIDIAKSSIWGSSNPQNQEGFHAY
jgi:hypothetical protein